VSDQQSLAEISNLLIYGSMLILFFATFGFAGAFAARKTRTVDLTDATEPATASPELASANTTAAPTNGAPQVPAAFAGVGDTQAPVDVDRLPPGRRAGNIGIALAWLGFIVLLAGVGLRGIWAERAPWGNMYEFSITSALAVLGVFLVLSIYRDVRWLGLFVIPAVLLTLGLAVTVLYTEAAQLVPALQSYWLVIHVSAAIICGGAFTVAGALAALYLISDRADRPAKGAISRGIVACGQRLPDAQTLDRLSYKLIAFAFPLWTFAVVAGAIWAESAWGRYWGWDPKETWAFITWVIFAGYLHARTTSGWKGRKAAILAIIGLAAYVFNYFGVNLLFPGLHSYSGV
jgi:cytochrome c-type biogenesis protein CcsB